MRGIISARHSFVDQFPHAYNAMQRLELNRNDIQLYLIRPESGPAFLWIKLISVSEANDLYSCFGDNLISIENKRAHSIAFKIWNGGGCIIWRINNKYKNCPHNNIFKSHHLITALDGSNDLFRLRLNNESSKHFDPRSRWWDPNSESLTIKIKSWIYNGHIIFTIEWTYANTVSSSL